MGIRIRVQVPFLPFKEARRFVHNLKLKSFSDWKKYYKSSKRPDNIPSCPGRTYKSEWKGYGDWLGTNVIAAQNKIYRSFEEARRFVRTLNLKSYKEWYEYCKSGNKPIDIPFRVERTYKKDWMGIGDWLGVKIIANQNRKFLTFEKARNFSIKLNLHGQKDWIEYCKSSKMPSNIPYHPERTYKLEWISWGDWLGTGTIATIERKYLDFIEARNFARKLNLRSRQAWSSYCRENKPHNIPTNPVNVYGDKWISWADWLGKDSKSFLSFEDAKESIKKLNIHSQIEWMKYVKSERKLSNIPSSPRCAYKNKWKGWGDWLGTNNLSPLDRKSISFLQAREFSMNLGLKTCTEWINYHSKHKPFRIPRSPHIIYKNEWISWRHWLGNEK